MTDSQNRQADVARAAREAAYEGRPGLRAFHQEGIAQCEQHPGVIFPHGDCAGPGEPLLDAPR